MYFKLTDDIAGFVLHLRKTIQKLHGLDHADVKALQNGCIKIAYNDG